MSLFASHTSTLHGSKSQIHFLCRVICMVVPESAFHVMSVQSPIHWQQVGLASLAVWVTLLISASMSELPFSSAFFAFLGLLFLAFSAADLITLRSFESCVLFLPLLSSRDPRPIAEILSDPRLIPYRSSNSILTILRYSDTTLTKTPNSEYPPNPPTHFLSLSELQMTSENPDHISVFICLHHSILVLLNSKFVFMSSSQFSPFHF